MDGGREEGVNFAVSAVGLVEDAAAVCLWALVGCEVATRFPGA